MRRSRTKGHWGALKRDGDALKSGGDQVSNEVDLSELSEVVNVYRAACSEINKWTKIRDDLNKTIKGLMRDREIGLVNGVPAIRCQTITTTRFDSKQFREEFPELADKYMYETTTQRLSVINSEASS